MTCRSIENQLAGFHLAALDDGGRAAIETHLCGCPACLVQYFEMKRAFDLGAASSALPSPAVRRRLRAAARDAFGRMPVRLALAGLVAAAAAIFLAVRLAPVPSVETPSAAQVDSASPVATNLSTL